MRDEGSRAGRGNSPARSGFRCDLALGAAKRVLEHKSPLKAKCLAFYISQSLVVDFPGDGNRGRASWGGSSHGRGHFFRRDS